MVELQLHLIIDDKEVLADDSSLIIQQHNKQTSAIWNEGNSKRL